jgi:hypothetical protein
MQFGFGLPRAGAAANGPDIVRFAQRAEVIDDVRRCQDSGMQQLTFDYRTGRVDEMLKIIAHFAAEAVPAVRD